MTKPRYLKTSNKILFNIADEIWFLSGDRSTVMNYYSKRIILMNVYASVFTYFVFDKSKNAHKTLNFLERKINFVLTFGKMKGKLHWPLQGKVISNFGIIRNPETGTVTENVGIDIKIDE